MRLESWTGYLFNSSILSLFQISRLFQTTQPLNSVFLTPIKGKRKLSACSSLLHGSTMRHVNKTPTCCRLWDDGMETGNRARRVWPILGSAVVVMAIVVMALEVKPQGGFSSTSSSSNRISTTVQSAASNSTGSPSTSPIRRRSASDLLPTTTPGIRRSARRQ